VPAAVAATVGSGLLLLVGGLSVLLGVWADLGALLLVLFLGRVSNVLVTATR
jgi:hypothetical protein